MTIPVNNTLLLLVFGVFLVSSIIIPVTIVETFGYSFVGITSNGVEFPIILENQYLQNNNGTTNPDPNSPESIALAMIDGMGIQSRIIQEENDGRITHGQGVKGEDDSIKPYLIVNGNTDFAATVLKDDAEDAYFIPAFWKTYNYNNGLIDDTGENPNLIGYSNSKSMSGSNNVIIDSDGIHVSGTGIRVLKLNPMEGTDLILRTIIPNGASVELVESPNDLTTLSHDGSKYVLVSQSAVSTLSGSTIQTGFWESCHPNHGDRLSDTWPNPLWHYIDYSCGWHSTVYAYQANAAEISGLNAYVKDPTSAVGGSFSGEYYTGTAGPYSVTVSGDPSYAGSTSGDYYVITSMSKSQTTEVDRGTLSVEVTGTFTVEEAEPYTSQINLTEDTETPYTMPAGDLYLIVEPNGETVDIKGESLDTNPFITVTNLPANIPYQITKDGIAIATGMASATGEILIDTIENSPAEVGGFLQLYPDSLSYRGAFSTVVFDNLNKQTIHIDTADDKTYVVHAYAKIPVTGDVTITNLNLDETLLIPYLDGLYSTGDSIYVPVIPGYHTINLTINDVPTLLNYADILGGTGIKIADPTSSTITNEDLDTRISSITTSAGTPAFVIATADGTVNAILTETISGTITITNTYTLQDIPPIPPAPVPRDPLEGFVEVYVNGVLINTITLGINPNPAFDSTNIISGDTAIQSVTYTYGDYTLSGSTSVNVSPGDFVEFYLYGEIYGEIEDYTVPDGFTLVSERGTATATANIRDAHIQTG